MLTAIAAANYRSLHQLVAPLAALTVISGPNGSGKSNIYRALRLLAQTAQGGVVGAIAREGGLASSFWAGPEKISKGMRAGTEPVQGGPRHGRQRLLLGFAEDDFSYCVDLGLPAGGPDAFLPAGGPTAFMHDPEIKLECIWAGPILRPASVLVDRRGSLLRARDGRSWRVLDNYVPAHESMLARSVDPESAPEMLQVRERVRSWRFYDHFRTDQDAPSRQSLIGTRTSALSHDGSDLAAALQTIIEIGDREGLEAALDDAFPGAGLSIESSDGRFTLWLRQPGLLRPLSAAELSDGTLRYLLLLAALLTPRPPPLLVLNEPETSLHPDLLPALGRLIIQASRHTQVWVIAHSSRLIAALEKDEQTLSLCLEKELGQTRIRGHGLLDGPPWNWPER